MSLRCLSALGRKSASTLFSWADFSMIIFQVMKSRPECVLLHSGRDFMTWKMIMEKSAQENNVDADFLPNALKHLNDMNDYARGAVCRHRALVNYFGQGFDGDNCGACDVCLGDGAIV